MKTTKTFLVDIQWTSFSTVFPSNFVLLKIVALSKHFLKQLRKSMIYSEFWRKNENGKVSWRSQYLRRAFVLAVTQHISFCQPFLFFHEDIDYFQTFTLTLNHIPNSTTHDMTATLVLYWFCNTNALIWRKKALLWELPPLTPCNQHPQLSQIFERKQLFGTNVLLMCTR